MAVSSAPGNVASSLVPSSVITHQTVSSHPKPPGTGSSLEKTSCFPEEVAQIGVATRALEWA